MEELREQIRAAHEQGTTLDIRGGGSKTFLGQAVTADLELPTKGLAGIIDYQPEELFIRALAGTSLLDIEKLLADNGQMLPFEPPRFSPSATLGGAIACGLSGPSRPWRGAARDFVLGCRMINGRGELLHFGGEVIKNVAGYDVSRLQCGAFGTLGLLVELSIKTVPAPRREITLCQQADEATALDSFVRWNRQPLPLSGAAWHGGKLWIRLSGTPAAVEDARRQIGADEVDDNGFWQDLKEQQLPFFHDERPLWRLSLPRNTGRLKLPGDILVDWGGAQRWLLSEAPAAGIQQLASESGGHASSFRNGPFQPLAPAVLLLHRRLKQAFDPKGIFNPGRLYAGL
ncbi:MAG TPA: glycolate oxidase subunit GlcE [Thiolapillus brandeum]|uniref:Glycolate oxidase subunit GlcE n=1 Tax=Thiolapillus brandeum TaxID=1076588 RepID=A0A831RXA3_9GAMM|nr:glycolate oxidase subunit GlcE [Thiolapillus brandeum]